jgi:hypothetical protein
VRRARCCLPTLCGCAGDGPRPSARRRRRRLPHRPDDTAHHNDPAIRQASGAIGGPRPCRVWTAPPPVRPTESLEDPPEQGTPPKARHTSSFTPACLRLWQKTCGLGRCRQLSSDVRTYHLAWESSSWALPRYCRVLRRLFGRARSVDRRPS